MTNFITGADALAALNATNEGGKGGGSSKYSSFKIGSKYVVRAMTANDIAGYYAYGNYNRKIDTIVPTEPPTFDDRGFPKSNLTPFDKASKYYTELMFAETDEDKKAEYRNEAAVYRGKNRFALGLIDLDTGTPIYIDLTKAQAKVIHSVIAKAAEKGKLGSKAFEIEKSGGGTNTVVTCTQLDLDDLNDKQAANFDKVEGFDAFSFDGLNYEADEAEQVKILRHAGFDVSLIGYGEAAPSIAETDEDDLPF